MTWTLGQLATLVLAVVVTGGGTAGLCYLLWHRAAPAPVQLPPVVEHPTPAEAADRARRDAEIAAHAGELDPEKVAG